MLTINSDYVDCFSVFPTTSNSDYWIRWGSGEHGNKSRLKNAILMHSDTTVGRVTSPSSIYIDITAQESCHTTIRQLLDYLSEKAGVMVHDYSFVANQQELGFFYKEFSSVKDVSEVVRELGRIFRRPNTTIESSEGSTKIENLGYGKITFSLKNYCKYDPINKVVEERAEPKVEVSINPTIPKSVSFAYTVLQHIQEAVSITPVRRVSEDYYYLPCLPHVIDKRLTAHIASKLSGNSLQSVIQKTIRSIPQSSPAVWWLKQINNAEPEYFCLDRLSVNDRQKFNRALKHIKHLLHVTKGKNGKHLYRLNYEKYLAIEPSTVNFMSTIPISKSDKGGR